MLHFIQTLGVLLSLRVVMFMTQTVLPVGNIGGINFGEWIAIHQTFLPPKLFTTRMIKN